jgi:ribosome-binding protein aMBF1 (putative translation factor)
MNNKNYQPVKCNHKKELKEALKSSGFKKEYHALEEEFAALDVLLIARKKAGLTQQEVAEKMGTKRPVVSRIEGLAFGNAPSPSFKTLKIYAHAVGCKLQIKLVHN